MKTLLLLILLAFVTSCLFGQSPPTASKFDQDLLGGTNPTLTPQEKDGVAVTQAWKDKSLVVSQPGVSSSVQFKFGENYPTVVCAILNVTDVELQAGEIVTHVNLGDSARWTVESAISGSGANQVQHLVIKPRDIGLSTSLVVMTDRRTYHILLVSDNKDFCHDVQFVYPAEAASLVASRTPSATPVKVAKADPLPRKKQATGKQVVSREPVDDADENYVIQGKPSWRPISAYSKDGHTYLQMPKSALHGESPVLFEEKKSGMFHHSKDLVNYRVHGRWYVCDRVLDSATLVSGVGSSQQRVTIRHSKVKEVASGQ
jgi:P-type conjugative transfer protein TrbG